MLGSYRFIFLSDRHCGVNDLHTHYYLRRLQRSLSCRDIRVSQGEAPSLKGNCVCVYEPKRKNTNWGSFQVQEINERINLLQIIRQAWLQVMISAKNEQSPREYHAHQLQSGRAGVLSTHRKGLYQTNSGRPRQQSWWARCGVLWFPTIGLSPTLLGQESDCKSNS